MLKYSWADYFPGWKDNYKRVRMLVDNNIVEGQLIIFDHTSGEEEAPMFLVKDYNGVDHSFVDCDRWEFV